MGSLGHWVTGSRGHGVTGSLGDGVTGSLLDHGSPQMESIQSHLAHARWRNSVADGVGLLWVQVGQSLTCVHGSPSDCAAIAPTISPAATTALRDRLSICSQIAIVDSFEKVRPRKFFDER